MTNNSSSKLFIIHYQYVWVTEVPKGYLFLIWYTIHVVPMAFWLVTTQSFLRHRRHLTSYRCMRTATKIKLYLSRMNRYLYYCNCATFIWRVHIPEALLSFVVTIFLFQRFDIFLSIYIIHTPHTHIKSTHKRVSKAALVPWNFLHYKIHMNVHIFSVHVRVFSDSVLTQTSYSLTLKFLLIRTSIDRICELARICAL